MIDENLNDVINPDVAAPEKEDIKKNLDHYRKTLYYMGANVPIGVLCLPQIEKALLKAGLLRVYDLISRDLTEIEGIGSARLDLLASRLDEFFTIGI